MLYYETRTELRKEVEKRIGHPLGEDTWRIVKPESEPPYDKRDLDETLDGLPKPKRIDRRQIAQFSQRLFIPSRQDAREGLRREATKVRKMLGIGENALPLDRLEETLLRLGANRMTGVPLPYLRGEGSIEDVSYWEIGYVFLPMPGESNSDVLVYLPHFISLFSYKLGVHPSIALSYIICDIELPDYERIAIHKDFADEIEIRVERPLNVSPKKVAEAYGKLRNEMAQQAGISNWRKKPRRSEMSMLLIEFIDATCEGGLHGRRAKAEWANIWNRWNNSFPQKAYKNVESMQAAFYRARSRLRTAIRL
ncbi:MAG: hypothetical protein HOC20_11530 [Chloroflexi bacterium]|jgi:hypothetical protein|nr:hypothetical protein [Chloroflexota bacterium]